MTKHCSYCTCRIHLLLLGLLGAEPLAKLGNTASAAGLSVRANEAPHSLASLKIEWGKNVGGGWGGWKGGAAGEAC